MIIRRTFTPEHTYVAEPASVEAEPTPPNWAHAASGLEPHLGGSYLDAPDLNTWMPDVWEMVIQEFGIQSVLDLGCGAGFTLKWMATKGVYCSGVEGDEPAIAAARERGCQVQPHDYTTGAYDPVSVYDLCWCAEFVEHVEEKYRCNFLRTMQQCRYVLMTFALPGQNGHHHVNCQTEDYWQKVMRQAGFDELREHTLKYRATCRGGEGWGRPTLMMFRSRIVGHPTPEYWLGPLQPTKDEGLAPAKV